MGSTSPTSNSPTAICSPTSATTTVPAETAFFPCSSSWTPIPYSPTCCPIPCRTVCTHSSTYPGPAEPTFCTGSAETGTSTTVCSPTATAVCSSTTATICPSTAATFCLDISNL